MSRLSRTQHRTLRVWPANLAAYAATPNPNAESTTATISPMTVFPKRRLILKRSLEPDFDHAIVRERRVLSAIPRHQNIIELHGSGNYMGRPYLLLEDLGKETVQDKLDSGLTFSAQETWPVIKEVARALAHIHKHGHVHRDVKPEHISLKEGRVGLFDFGITVIEGQITKREKDKGSLFCTPQYGHPEALEGRPPAKHFDTYSLGLLAFEMRTGQCLLSEIVKKICQKNLYALLGPVIVYRAASKHIKNWVEGEQNIAPYEKELILRMTLGNNRFTDCDQIVSAL